MILKINDRIRNRRVEFFNSFDITLSYDSVASTFSFDFYFDPNNQEHVELACLGHFHIATLEHNNELIMTSNVLSESFSSSSIKQLVKFSGYSLPGVLEDCNIPPDFYPIQYDGLSLRQIVNKVLPIFKLKYVVDPVVGSLMDQTYAKVVVNPTQSVKGLLTELAAQKNIVITHNEKGQVLFTRAKTAMTPILNFDASDKSGVPFTKMELTFNGQPMHSHITVLKEVSEYGGNAGEFTIRNPFVPFVYRPKVITQSAGTDIDTELAARTALSEELKNIKLTIVTDRWEINGKIIKPNNIISVKNKELYLFNSTKWFIESVRLVGNNLPNTAVLTCVLPEVYNMNTPQYIFKGINIH